MNLDVANTGLAASAVPTPQKMAAPEKPRADAKRTGFAKTEKPSEDNTSRESAVSETMAAIRESLKEIANPPATRLSILYDTDSSQFVQRSINAGTGEVVYQYPAESALRRAAAHNQLLAEAVEKALDITV